MSGNIFLQTTTVSVREFGSVARIPVSRTDDLSAATTVEFLVSGVSAVDGEDFVGTVSTITIPAGADSAFIEVPIIDDGVGEPTETFQVSLIRADSGTLLAPRTAIVSILDDETPAVEPARPPFISSYTVEEIPVLTSLDQPISLEFTEDGGRIYVAEKSGVIKAFDVATGALLSTVLDISEKVNDAGDRGLMDIALSPDFATDRTIFAIYVVDPPETTGNTGPAGPDGIGNRFVYLSRFVLDATGLVADAASETILVGAGGQSLADISGGGALDFTAAEFAGNVSSAVDPSSPTGFKTDYWKVDAQSHLGGSLEFGEDGALYVTTGDGGSYNIPDRRNIEVQAIDSLTGKVLRIDPETGLGLPDNPFATDDLSENRSKVFQLGLRNPFTMAIDDGKIILADTGWGQAEEINIGAPGANFGWPFFEGGDGVLLETPGYDIYPEWAGFFEALARGEFAVTPAFKGFSRSAVDPGYQVQAIVGADGVHDGSAYPKSLDGHYFFADVARTNVFAINLNDPTDVNYLYSTGGIIAPVYFEPSPDGEMYYVDLLKGEIGKLAIADAPVEMALNGSATYDAEDGSYRLTGSSGGFYPGTAGSRFQAGSAFSTGTMDLAADFAIEAEIYLGTNDAGADGLAFVIHASPDGETALGANGGGLGAGGIANGLAVEFDTFDGAPDDIPQDHVAAFDTDAGGTGPLGGVVAVPNLENGRWHDVVVSWNASAGELVTVLDGVEVNRTQIDSAAVFGGASEVRFGFTAATGGATNEHKVRLGEVITGNGSPAAIPVAWSTAGAAAIDGATGAILPVGADGRAHAAGAATSDFRIDLDEAFSIAFAYLMDDDDGAADGIGFAFHDLAGAPLGMSGGNVGLVGLGEGAGDILAVEIDTYDNGAVDGDIESDHLTVFLGDAQESPLQPPVDLGNVEDGAWHALGLAWNPVAGELTVSHDGAVLAVLDGAGLLAAADPASNTVRLSVTGATGGATSVPEVRLVELDGTVLATSSPATIALGSAVVGEDGAVTLTSGLREVGGLALAERVDLSSDFLLRTTVSLDGSGADGIAFVLHDDPRGALALGWDGGNLGAIGITRMFGFELDVHDNGASLGDLPADHAGVVRSSGAGWISEDPVAVPEFVPGDERAVALSWDADRGILSLFLDGLLLGETDAAALGAATADADAVWLSITGATGGLSANQTVSIDEFSGLFA